jgi:hypothetical protein
MNRMASVRPLIYLWILFLFISPSAVWGQGAGPHSPFEEPLISEEELIQKKKWDQKTQLELQQEYDHLKQDISLMEKRLDQLRGLTRLNQDQYREKDILDELTYIKQRELTILGKLIQGQSMTAPDFRLPGTLGSDITLKEFRGKKNVLLVFYLFDFSPT